MTNLVVVSFTNESQAIEASHKMIELESLGDITVYEKVIVKKKPMARSPYFKPILPKVCALYREWPLVH